MNLRELVDTLTDMAEGVSADGILWDTEVVVEPEFGHLPRRVVGTAASYTTHDLFPPRVVIEHEGAASGPAGIDGHPVIAWGWSQMSAANGFLAHGHAIIHRAGHLAHQWAVVRATWDGRQWNAGDGFYTDSPAAAWKELAARCMYFTGGE